MLKALSLGLQKLRAMAGGYIFGALMLLAAFLLFFTARLAIDKKAPDTLTLAIVDEDNTETSAQLAELIASSGSAVKLIPCADREKAFALSDDGSAEGVIVLVSGLRDALLADGAAAEFFPAKGTASAEAARELIAGQAVLMRSRLRSVVYAEKLLGRELTESEAAEVYAIAEHNFAAGRSSAVILNSGGSAKSASVLGAFYARLNGFFAFTAMLMILMLASFAGSDDERAAAERMRSVKGGAANFAALMIAPVLFGLLLLALFIIVSGGTDAVGASAGAAYILCISSLALLLSSLSGSARTELASPFIALITSLAGGCFIDPDALGGALKTVSLFTPQGQYLAAASGRWQGFALMIALAAVFAAAGAAAVRKKRG